MTFLLYVLVYVDDLLIFSRNDEEHRRHLEQVLKLMHENALVARLVKCVFGVDAVNFLGHRISADGIRPLN